MEPLSLDLGEDDDYLFWLRRETDNVREAVEQQNRCAIACRERGISWEAIGKAMRISRQAAQQRFGKPFRAGLDPWTEPQLPLNE